METLHKKMSQAFYKENPLQKLPLLFAVIKLESFFILKYLCVSARKKKETLVPSFYHSKSSSLKIVNLFKNLNFSKDCVI